MEVIFTHNVMDVTFPPNITGGLKRYTLLCRWKEIVLPIKTSYRKLKSFCARAIIIYIYIFLQAHTFVLLFYGETFYIMRENAIHSFLLVKTLIRQFTLSKYATYRFLREAFSEKLTVTDTIASSVQMFTF